MRITGATVQILSKPCVWYAFGTHEVYYQEALVRVFTNEGIEGNYMVSYEHTDIEEFVRRFKHNKNEVVGQDPLCIEKIWKRLSSIGWSNRALAPLDICL
jgi:hypothetical protein